MSRININSINNKAIKILIKRITTYVLILSICSTILSLINPITASASSGKTVRVGWFQYPGMQEGTDEDSLYGYNYEFLQRISVYTGWNYEFVYGTASELEGMLRDGDIDLIGYIGYTDERNAQFLYSHYAAGYTTSCIIGSDSVAQTLTDDYSSLDGATVATLNYPYRIQFLKDFARSHNIHFKFQLFDSLDSCYNAIDNETADIMMTTIDNLNNGKNIIYQYEQSAFYFLINKQREDLLKDIDDAMSKILLSNSNYRQHLMDKYFYNHINNIRSAYTASEKEFIAACSDIKVAVVQNDFPMSFLGSDGKYYGFIYDYLQLLSDEANITFIPIRCRNYNSALRALSTHQADIMLQFNNDYNYAEANNVTLTQPYLSMDSGLIHKPHTVVQVIGVEKDTYVNSELTNSGDYSIKEYSDYNKCLDALLSGNVDALITNNYYYQKLAADYSDYDFSYQALTGEIINYSVAISKDYNPKLAEVLEKAISNISDEQVYNSINNVISIKTSFSLSQWMHSNRYTLVLMAIFILLVIILLFLFFQSRISKMQSQLNLKLIKANKELKKANSAKSEFLARTSHDLRTPMNAITGLTALALDESSVREKDFYLSQIATSSEFLLGLINDVLDMDKIENGAIELHPAPYAYEDFSQMISTMIGSLCRDKNIEFLFDRFDYTEPLLVDHIRFNQIFFNLLSNAVKYTPSGGTVTFSLTNHEVVDGIAKLDFMIADTGIGMSDEFMAHMYDPFSQENRIDRNKTPGSGLGLAIVKSMIDLMGGSIDVESHLDEGTIFLIHLDCPVATDIAEASSSIDPIEMNEYLRGKRVLLVDDQPLNLEVAKKILEKKQIDVTIAENGEIAYNTYMSKPPFYFDAILMDIRMPVMDGLESATNIRASKRTDSALIPIIAMTANTFDEDKERSKEAGMNAHLGKPIVPKELFIALYRNIKRV